ncbi:MAG: 3-hydroxyisobutyryl-CoA hydrolase [Micrococcales bacterium 70-64]|nr:MAG: 3-hydroxyisobutyryl-CoA hydrolase [Leifsonia sp. SCN 70-46]OJX86180.1 MAG: 3-hydroxyisobutyryl-CoA hydrolase [Micrococcales bacterium 70-64]
MEDVLLERRGPLAHITLNRPHAMNALTHGMVVAIAAALDGWEHDDSVERILLTGAGERGLCAGGDIVSMYRDATAGDGSVTETFWRDEFALNARIARYPKPFVAVMDGVTLGGGVGVSARASHRVVTERSLVGMPETTIGYIPDVGGTWLLSHTPGELGTYLALSARPVGPGDAIALGLADWFVPSELLPALIESGDPASVAQVPPPVQLVRERGWIDEAFAGDDLAGILERIEGREVAAVIAGKSPTALAVTLASLRRSRELPDLEAALAQEFRVSMHALAMPDFAEGIRAQVIDKDRTPRWNPARVEDVTGVESFFAPVERELWTR